MMLIIRRKKNGKTYRNVEAKGKLKLRGKGYGKN